MNTLHQTDDRTGPYRTRRYPTALIDKTRRNLSLRDATVPTRLCSASRDSSGHYQTSRQDWIGLVSAQPCTSDSTTHDVSMQLCTFDSTTQHPCCSTVRVDYSLLHRYRASRQDWPCLCSSVLGFATIRVPSMRCEARRLHQVRLSYTLLFDQARLCSAWRIDQAAPCESLLRSTARRHWTELGIASQGDKTMFRETQLYDETGHLQMNLNSTAPGDDTRLEVSELDDGT